MIETIELDLEKIKEMAGNTQSNVNYNGELLITTKYEKKY